MHGKVDGTSIEAAEAREALSRRGKPLARIVRPALTIEVRQHKADLWVIFRRKRDGGLALRTSLLAEDTRCTVEEARDDEMLAIEAVNALGAFRIELHGEATGLELFQHRVVFTPRQSLHLPYLPRDLVPFGRGGDPQASEGSVEARQRRLNTGLCYLKVTKPDFGKVLYVQNLTALNDYFLATETKPEGVVGGEWPLLGYLPPTHPADPAKAVPAGRPITLSDARLVFRQKAEEDEAEAAWQFLDMLSAAYTRMDKPRTQRRDWLGRCRKTLRDLAQSPKAQERHYGNLYFHPYTAAEHPDSMVQLALLTAIQDWSRWNGGEAHPLEAAIARGMEKFFDPKLGTLRRYLPDVGKDKDADAVDSWYLYHPLLNLSNLALAGEDWARDLFLRSIDYGIRAARHFAYKWPIMFKIDDFAIITAVADGDDLGQTDVGGIYAWVMLQAFQLTEDVRFLQEARAAIDAAEGMRFDLNYQANLTAWGAAACMRLWRITDDKHYLAQSYVYLASFFHNCQIWESRIGHARHYSNFLGATCLHDAPYMAIYECYDSYAAFERYLDLGGPDLIPASRKLVTEYCRYALHRAWWYYPDALPSEAVAKQQRNGEIDPSLSFPVEDLYPDGQPAGQVGQEIYGSGAAMVFATRSCHRIDGGPFTVACDHFLRAFTRLDNATVSFKLEGEPDNVAELALVRAGRRKLPNPIVRTQDGKVIQPKTREPDAICYEIPANSGIVLSW